MLGGTTRSSSLTNPAEAHPAGNTTQAHWAWSPSVPTGEPLKTIHGQWPAPTALQLAGLVEEANANSRGDFLLLEQLGVQELQWNLC